MGAWPLMTGSPKDDASGRLLAAAMVSLFAAAGSRAASAAVNGWGMLDAAIGSGTVALTCLGVVLWRIRDRL